MDERDQHDDDRALDRLLAQARWEEPDAEDEYRLREDWAHLRQRRGRIAPMVYFAVAASIAVIMGGVVLQLQRSANQVEVKYLVPDIKPSTAATTMGVPEEYGSREANSYELLLMAQPMPRRQVDPVAIAPKPSPPVVDPSVQKLVKQLGDPLVKNRYDAAKELAMTDAAVVVPILMGMVEQGHYRREALAALMMSRDPLAAEALEEVKTSQTVEAQVIALRSEIR